MADKETFGEVFARELANRGLHLQRPVHSTIQLLEDQLLFTDVMEFLLFYFGRRPPHRNASTMLVTKVMAPGFDQSGQDAVVAHDRLYVCNLCGGTIKCPAGGLADRYVQNHMQNHLEVFSEAQAIAAKLEVTDE